MSLSSLTSDRAVDSLSYKEHLDANKASKRTHHQNDPLADSATITKFGQQRSEERAVAFHVKHFRSTNTPPLRNYRK